MKHSAQLDLHGVSHEDSEDIIEKFITDNLDNLPVSIITGDSQYFRDKVQIVSNRYALGCYQTDPHNFGLLSIFSSRWKEFDKSLN